MACSNGLSKQWIEYFVVGLDNIYLNLSFIKDSRSGFVTEPPY